MNASNPRLDLNDVALFVQVVTAGSFAGAARRSGIPANTVSRRIQSLEKQLGVRLLQRSTRKLTLTDVGHRFHAQCADEVDALLQSAERVVDDNRLPNGRLRIAAPADFSNWFPMAWLTEFLAAHPGVRIEFVLSDARADLIEEAIDLVFRAGQVIEPHLVARRIGTSNLGLVASPGYLADHGTPRSVAELARHDCIFKSTPTGRSPWRLDGPNGTAEVEVSGRFAANTARAMVDAAIAGLGIALLPTTLTASAIQLGQLVPVMPEQRQDGVGVYFVYLSRKQLAPAVSVFIDFAIAHLRDAGMIEGPLFVAERVTPAIAAPAGRPARDRARTRR